MCKRLEPRWLSHVRSLDRFRHIRDRGNRRLSESRYESCPSLAGDRAGTVRMVAARRLALPVDNLLRLGIWDVSLATCFPGPITCRLRHRIRVTRVAYDILFPPRSSPRLPPRWDPSGSTKSRRPSMMSRARVSHHSTMPRQRTCRHGPCTQDLPVIAERRGLMGRLAHLCMPP